MNFFIIGLVFGILFFIGFICLLVFLKNARDNFFYMLISFFTLILFIYTINTLYKIINSTMRIDNDVTYNKEITLYKYLPVLLYSIISFIELVVLYILFLKNDIRTNPQVFANLIVKVFGIILVLHLMLFLTKRGFYMATWVIGLIPIILMGIILMYSLY